jgi:ABC-2 type transport system ATP-binding protein
LTTPMIDVRDFRKTFLVGLRRRPMEAARRISLEVERGEIFGFLGPNGAGKTTTIKALLGLIRPDGGTLAVVGHPVASKAWRSKVGYMPEHPNFHEYLSAFEMVAWFARLSGMVRAEAEQEARRLLERVGLAAAMHRRLRSYSKGMLQRAGLAQALVARPELLILDEPMTGLDPIGRRELRDLILELRAEGKTIFYSTHILPDVEMTCDRVSIIHRGATLRAGRLVDILEETHRGVVVVLRGASPALAERARAEHLRAKVSDDALEVVIEDLEVARRFVAEAVAGGALLARFEQHREDLETIFLRTLGKDGLGGEPT